MIWFCFLLVEKLFGVLLTDYRGKTNANTKLLSTLNWKSLLNVWNDEISPSRIQLIEGIFESSLLRNINFLYCSGLTAMRRNCLNMKAVCAMDHTSGGLKITVSAVKMPSMAWWLRFTALPSTPACMGTSYAWGSTWMVWTAELENTLLCLFTWCRVIMTTSLSGHLPGGSLCPSWISRRVLSSVIISVKPWWPSRICLHSKGQQRPATTKGMATSNSLQSSRSVTHSTWRIIPCWFVFKFFINLLCISQI